MSIMGVVYFDKYTNTYRVPAWARAERYEYCDNSVTPDTDGKKKNILQRVAALMLSIF